MCSNGGLLVAGIPNGLQDAFTKRTCLDQHSTGLRVPTRLLVTERGVFDGSCGARVRFQVTSCGTVNTVLQITGGRFDFDEVAPVMSYALGTNPVIAAVFALNPSNNTYESMFQASTDNEFGRNL